MNTTPTIPRRKPRVKPPLTLMAMPLSPRQEAQLIRLRAGMAGLNAGTLVPVEVEAIDGRRQWRVSSLHRERDGETWRTYYVRQTNAPGARDDYSCGCADWHRHAAEQLWCKHVWCMRERYYPVVTREEH